MDKIGEFIADVTKRHVLGKLAGWCYSVEHQKRGTEFLLVLSLFILFFIVGMPHIHMLMIMDKQGRVTTPAQVDQYICARVPPLPPMDDFSPEANQARRLHHTVTSCMLHDCNKACLVDSPDGLGKSCSKKYPKPFSEYTELSG